MLYAVVGASGHTGKIVTETLLAHGHQVRVIGREASKLVPFVEKGAESWVGSIDDASFLTQVFSGVDAVYALIPPNYIADDFRSFQGKIGAAIVEAIKNAGVRYVVNLSSLGADLPEGTGVVAGLYDQEQRLNQLEGVNVLHLRPAYFMENLLGSIGIIKQMGANGSPLRGDISFPIIATSDVGKVAAERLLKLDFSGKQVFELLGAQDYTMTEVTSILGQAIGKPELRYMQFSYEAAEQGMISMGLSANAAHLLVELNQAINEGKAISGTARTMEGTTETTLEQFAPIFAYIYNQN
jgi:uncharacterized protein YbjT (DUF2867 family)